MTFKYDRMPLWNPLGVELVLMRLNMADSTLTALSQTSQQAWSAGTYSDVVGSYFCNNLFPVKFPSREAVSLVANIAELVFQMSTWQLLQPTRRRLLHRRSQRLRPPARRPRRPPCQLRPRRPRSRRHNPYRHCSAAAWGGGAAGRADGQSSFVSFELQAATKFILIFCHA